MLKQALFALSTAIVSIVFLSGCGGGGTRDDGDDYAQDLPQLFAAGWTKDLGVRQGDPMRWNPDVIDLGNGQWRMYYEYFDNDQTHRIYSAISNDGLNWTDEPGTRVNMANMPSAVVLPDGKVRLYYNSAGTIKSSISDDGLAFAQEDGIRLQKTDPDEDGGIRHPDVLRMANGTFYMFYDAEKTSDNTFRIKYATSSDGLLFTKNGVIVEPMQFGALDMAYVDSVTTPGSVVDKDGNIQVFVTVRGATPLSNKVGIFQVSSTDGIHYILHPGAIISGYTTGGVSNNPQDSAPIQFGSGLKVFYWIGAAGATADSSIYSASHP